MHRGRGSLEAASLVSVRLERVLWRQGILRVAGVDEVGRGPLAGPVVAAAVILGPDVILPGVKDSKQLSPRARAAAYERIVRGAVGWAVAGVGPERIDGVNIRNAAFEAMARAVRSLPGDPPAFLIIDGNAEIPERLLAGAPEMRQRAVVGADRKVLSVAAASIIAKVTRDRMAEEWERLYPGYGFLKHKGYGTLEHLAALAQLGPCPIHRRSFLGGRQVRLALGGAG